MRRPTPRLTIAVAVAAVASFIPLAVAGGPAPGAAPRTSSSACPESTLPANPATNVWEKTAYQAKYSANTLAAQVLACEMKFHPATAVLAEIALIGLNEAAHGAATDVASEGYQNQNMWLANNAGDLTAQNDFKTLGIPALNLEDGPDGIIYRSTKGATPTVLPDEMALASSMNPGLAEQYGKTLSAQAAALHFMGIQAPDLNLDRIPNWGRIFETFGEDPVLAGEMGAAEAIGILKDTPLVVLKHYGVYGQETNRKSVNWIVSSSALYNTYLRPFAIATDGIAASSAVPAHREVALMCSYGDINGVRSCASQQLKTAEDTLDFSGLVRSDLDTVTTPPALLRAGVSLIKPLDAQVFELTKNVSAADQSLIENAARIVLSTMFAARLVSPSEIKASSSIGSLSGAEASAGLSVANGVEEDGAVLLKDGTLRGLGDLPLNPNNGKVAIIATSEMSATCDALVIYLGHHHVAATCTIWNSPPDAPTDLLHDLPHASSTHHLTRTISWVAPSTGPYVVDNTSFGDSSLLLNGTVLMSEPGISELYAPNDVTLNVMKGHPYTFTEQWEAVGPILSVTSLSSHIATAVTAAEHAKSALVLADDYSTEGADIDELGLPEGQDALISAVEDAAPTSVALFTTGPVVMPWLTAKTRSLIEMWNPGGNPPFGTDLSDLVPAYGALLTGLVSPQGHLPITFPEYQNESPLDLGTGLRENAYWPGDGGTSDLDLAPLDGEVIGYGWYQDKNWPVLFPFGYGLTYATMTQSFDTASTACADEDSATSICVPVAVRLALPDTVQAADAVQVYVAQPQLSGDPAPTLLLGDAQSVTCHTAGTAGTLTGQCASPNDVDVTISAVDVGQWNATSQSYQFSTGCYSFVVAPNAEVAFHELSSPSSYPADDVVHTTYPFSSATTLTSGKCPGGE